MKAVFFIAMCCLAGALAFDAENRMETDADIQNSLALASQAELEAAAYEAHANFMRVQNAVQIIASLSAEEREVARTVVGKYGGDVGQLKVGEMTRADQAELIPMVVGVTRDVNMKLAKLARIVSGESEAEAVSVRHFFVPLFSFLPPASSLIARVLFGTWCFA